jgi:hypothetical protein
MKISEIKHKSIVSGTYRVLYVFEKGPTDVFVEGKKVQKERQTIIIVDQDSQVGDMSAKLQLFDDKIDLFVKDDKVEIKDCWAIIWRWTNKEGKEVPQPIIKEGKNGEIKKV